MSIPAGESLPTVMHSFAEEAGGKSNVLEYAHAVLQALGFTVN
jgi:hypothetical protein